jgi:hypothetical protein
MSAITIAGDTSGSVTLDAPAVAGTTVLTLPATSGTVMVNGPAFSAGKSATQSVSNSTFTRIVFDSEAFDTNNNYDISNGRFTPTVAGYYQFNVSLGFQGQSTQSIAINLYKNGSLNLYTALMSANANGLVASGSGLIYCNGSTDYIEVYGWQNTGGALNVGTAAFQGFLVRGA